MGSTTTPAANAPLPGDDGGDNNPLIVTLRRLDPVLQFLTKATGLTCIPLPTVRRTLPDGCCDPDMLKYVQALSEHGILTLLHSKQVPPNASAAVATDLSKDAALEQDREFSWENPKWVVGFPPPALSSSEEMAHKKARTGLAGGLHGSTKTAGKRRLAALKRLLKQQTRKVVTPPATLKKPPTSTLTSGEIAVVVEQQQEAVDDEDRTFLEEERTARDAVSSLFGFSNYDKDAKPLADRDALPTCVLPRQISYSGSLCAQESCFVDLSDECKAKIPPLLLKAFDLHPTSVRRRRLYRHQQQAIEAAMSNIHCAVCTGTGSGKSLCFLLPILASCYHTDGTALVLFPTKALAQDQFSKLQTLLNSYPDLKKRLVPATLDGDTPHSARAVIAETANIILTNPDTLHAAILPSWKTLYKSLLARLRYVIIDEAHMYEGVFGAHVACVLRRLVRLCPVAAHTMGRATTNYRLPTFLGASATLPWPEQHFRHLCPIAPNDVVKILTSLEDGSPRAAKHFFVWNPPVLTINGTSTGMVTFPPNNCSTERIQPGRKRARVASEQQDSMQNQQRVPVLDSDGEEVVPMPEHFKFHRRHAADETALLLVQAVTKGVRSIVFCKTRNLVEWVYERACTTLKGNPLTQHLVDRVESYRGGYSAVERRMIEQKLFQNDLLGVVGTNALELGVDIGGIDLTLHCGYPSSYTSLLQQAGRAGRGASRSGKPSLSITVCFNSAAEQHMWRHPETLLAKGITSPNTIPLSGGLVQGHMLCASGEFPLTGNLPVSSILGPREGDSALCNILSDEDLFGGDELYQEALDFLHSTRSLVEELVAVWGDGNSKISVFKAHGAMRKPWSRVSMRSIEPINYAIVDLSHPGQSGRMDAIHDQTAVMDILPYSRVFYHAHPGAMITHRGKKYKVVSMMRPPAFETENFGCRRSLSLAAFAKPSHDRYATRPLSSTIITVVKKLETVELRRNGSSSETDTDSSATAGDPWTFAGCGAVSVKKTVRGYKKLSLITRSEISRSELSLPPMEYDTFGIWFDVEAGELLPILGEKFGPGVHALSHALLAVAPLIVPGLCRSDLECDHSFFAPTLVKLFDERAGGSGACQRLWKEIFRPNSILEAAIMLLEECSFCSSDKAYDGGCPECLHASNCIEFNAHLSRTSAILIGKRMLTRVQQTKWYQENVQSAAAGDPSGRSVSRGGNNGSIEKNDGTPRRKARIRALRTAKDMGPARDRQIMVGRPSWPLDGDLICRQVHGD